MYKGNLCYRGRARHHAQGGGRVSTPEYSSTLLPRPTPPHLVGNVFCKPKCPRSLVATVHEKALSCSRVLREGVIWTLISQIVENDDSVSDRLI